MLHITAQRKNSMNVQTDTINLKSKYRLFKVKYPKSGHAQNWDRNLESHKKLLLPISFIRILMYSYSLYY